MYRRAYGPGRLWQESRAAAEQKRQESDVAAAQRQGTLEASVAAAVIADNIVMAHIVVALIVMADIVIAYIVMAVCGRSGDQ